MTLTLEQPGQILADAGDGGTNPYTIAALREGWAWTPRSWLRATSDTGVGDPSHAKVEDGARYFDDVTSKIAGFLVELAATPLNRLYEGEQ